MKTWIVSQSLIEQVAQMLCCPRSVPFVKDQRGSDSVSAPVLQMENTRRGLHFLIGEEEEETQFLGFSAILEFFFSFAEILERAKIASDRKLPPTYLWVLDEALAWSAQQSVLHLASNRPENAHESLSVLEKRPEGENSVGVALHLLDVTNQSVDDETFPPGHLSVGQ